MNNPGYTWDEVVNNNKQNEEINCVFYMGVYFYSNGSAYRKFFNLYIKNYPHTFKKLNEQVVLYNHTVNVLSKLYIASANSLRVVLDDLTASSKDNYNNLINMLLNNGWLYNKGLDIKYPNWPNN